MRKIGILFALGLAAVVCAALQASEEPHHCPMGREYFLYLPDNFDPAKTYWLFVGVHGYKGYGKGAGGWTDFTKKDCIVVGPSFPDGYQGLALATDKQLIGIFEELQKKYKLYPKMFLAGFSGGAQFTHRFALYHPEYVIGCAAHSAGSWDDSGRGSLKALAVPFVMSCGEADTARSVPDAKYTRIEWAHKFEEMLKAHHYYFKAEYYPGVGHARSKGAVELTEECFALATTGRPAAQRVEAAKLFAAVEKSIHENNPGEASKQLGELPKALAALDAARMQELRAAVAKGAVPNPENGWLESATGALALIEQSKIFAQVRIAELNSMIKAAAAH